MNTEYKLEQVIRQIAQHVGWALLQPKPNGETLTWEAEGFTAKLVFGLTETLPDNSRKQSTVAEISTPDGVFHRIYFMHNQGVLTFVDMDIGGENFFRDDFMTAEALKAAGELVKLLGIELK
jgi:hypothetical protein